MASQLSNFDIPSPCIGVCKIGKDNRCLGCYRTVEDIRVWKDATPTQKQAILVSLKQHRRKQGRIGRGEARHRRRRQVS